MNEPPTRVDVGDRARNRTDALPPRREPGGCGEHRSPPAGLGDPSQPRCRAGITLGFRGAAVARRLHCHVAALRARRGVVVGAGRSSAADARARVIALIGVSATCRIADIAYTGSNPVSASLLLTSGNAAATEPVGRAWRVGVPSGFPPPNAVPTPKVSESLTWITLSCRGVLSPSMPWAISGRRPTGWRCGDLVVGFEVPGLVLGGLDGLLDAAPRVPSVGQGHSIVVHGAAVSVVRLNHSSVFWLVGASDAL
jgi:hypothetical protein